MHGIIHLTGKQAGIVDALKWLLATVADSGDLAGIGQEYAHHGPVIFGVRPEIDKGIGVAAVDDGAGGGRQSGDMFVHCWITPRWQRMRNVASRGMCDQAGRLVSSYSISYSAFSRRNQSSNRCASSGSEGHRSDSLTFSR